jgi:hypothetical protein
LGAHAKQSVDRTPAKHGGAYQYTPDESQPARVAFEYEKQTQCEDSNEKTDDLIHTSYVCIHGIRIHGGHPFSAMKGQKDKPRVTMLSRGVWTLM